MALIEGLDLGLEWALPEKLDAHSSRSKSPNALEVLDFTKDALSELQSSVGRIMSSISSGLDKQDEGYFLGPHHWHPVLSHGD